MDIQYLKTKGVLKLYMLFLTQIIIIRAYAYLGIQNNHYICHYPQSKNNEE